MDDLGKERLRRSDPRRWDSGMYRPVAGAPAMVGVVTAGAGGGSVPATTGAYFLVHPVDVAGAENEGGVGLYTTGAAEIPVYVTGAVVPVAGDPLICRFVGHRWVAQKDSPTVACGSLCVTVPGCSGNLTGAFVSISLGGTLIGTAITSGQVSAVPMGINHGSGYTSPPAVTISGDGSGATATCDLRVQTVTLTAGGTGGTDGSYTDGTFSGGGGIGASFNYTVAGGVVTSVTRSAVGAGYTSPATAVFGAGAGAGAAASVLMSVGTCTVTASGSGYTSATVAFSGGGGSGATATATIVVRGCVPIATAGTYSVTASFTGYTTRTVSQVAPCGTTTTVNIALTPTTPLFPILFTVTNDNTCGGGQPIPGVLVTLLQSGVSVGTATTNGSGQCTIAAPSTGPFTATANLARFNTATVTVGTISSCTQKTQAITLSPATGYRYYQTCAIPTLSTLNFTDSVYGACTVSWLSGSDLSNPFGYDCWRGTNATASYGGNGTTCPPATFSITYYLKACGLNINSGYVQSDYDACPAGTIGEPGSTANAGAYNQGQGQSFTCPPAFSATVTDIHAFGALYPSGVTFTATE